MYCTISKSKYETVIGDFVCKINHNWALFGVDENCYKNDQLESSFGKLTHIKL